MRMLALLTSLIATTAMDQQAGGWRLEPGVDPPGYAVAVPQAATVNVDTVVLMCEPAGGGRVLQLQLYLTDEGPLLPRAATEGAIKDEPRAEIVIDGRSFATEILFAEDHAVLADAEREMVPALSPALLDAMAGGGRMTLRFDLIGDAAIDGTVTIDLAAGRNAIESVRRCATPAGPNISQAPER